MKTTINKILFLCTFFSLFFFSCSDNEADQSSDTDGENEVILEDLSKIADDEEYISYINTAYNSGKSIVDSNLVEEIINDVEQIPDERKGELAIAMGFENEAALEVYFEEQRNAIKAFLAKYDFDTTEINLANLTNAIDKDALNNDLIAEQSQKQLGDLTNVQDDPCPSAIVEESCLDSYELRDQGLNNSEYLMEYFCSDFEINSEDWNKCVDKLHASIAVNYDKLISDWCICMYDDCEWPDEIKRICPGFF